MEDHAVAERDLRPDDRGGVDGRRHVLTGLVW
jgi:hypothetical protein